MNASIRFFRDNVLNLKDSVFDVLLVLLMILGLLVIALLLYRRYLVRRCYKKEYWLPVVDNGGRVIGRVARSVSLETPGTYQHPLIRIMVLKSRTIYLSPRTYEFCPDIGKYDYPFECMMEYGNSVEETLIRMQEKYFPKSMKPRFLLKYKHENKIGHWQVLLYFLQINDEQELVGLDKSNGKFWTIQQIQENLGQSYFSAFLEGEMDFLESLLKYGRI